MIANPVPFAVLTALCCLTAAGWSGLDAADPSPRFANLVNLCPDGDFEHVDHRPQDWTGFGPGAEVVEDPDQPTGHVLRLQAAEGATPPAPVHATIVAHAMTRLMVSMRLRTSDLQSAAMTGSPVFALTVNGRGLGGEIPLAQLTVSRTADVDWTPLTTIVAVPPGIFVLTVAATLHGTGTVWIDDVVLNADPPVPAQVIGTEIPAWLTADASYAALIVDPANGTNWLRLQPDQYATAVTWASMAGDWKRISVTLRLRGSGLVLGTAARLPATAATAAPGPATATATDITAAMRVRAGVLATWVDDHDRPLSATFDDLMMPIDGDWTQMQLHLDIPRPGALLRLQAVLDGGGILDVDSVQVLPILSGE